MAVYYKFKSARDFDSVPIDGHFISVANLKEKIFESKHLGRGTDFDLMVSNAQTNEGRGILERKNPPPGYICHRCKVPGHFIQHCPTNGDPNYDVKKTKPPTGIPKSMLVPTTDGSYALPNGSVAYLKPNEAAFEKEIEGLPSTRSITDIPPELRCPLCKEVMQDAVLTSKCCFKSFCDKCIRNHILSKLACVCGATNVLADDLLPNRTVRETINRFLESNNSSADNAGSLFQVQDMESARPALHKVPSPTLSATSKGDQMVAQPTQPRALAPTLSASSKGAQLPPTQKDEDLNSKETVNEVKDTGAPPLSMGRAAKAVDASEATFESMNVKEPPSQGSAPLAEEEVQQRPSASEPGKKKKKKKARVVPNDGQWRAPQDMMGADNYMMPFPPNCDPYWGNMQFGMDGYMNPYNGAMPYMGYVPGPFDVPMGGMPPLDPFGGQGYMMPVPPQREFSDFPMGPNVAPPVMGRAEFEARKADLRRRRAIEGRGERAGAKDVEFNRDMTSNGNISSMKPRHRMTPLGGSPDHPQNFHRRGEREPGLEGPPRHRVEREPSPDRVPHHRIEREPSQDRAHHHRMEREPSQDRVRHHRIERDPSPDRSHYSHHHRSSHYHGPEREMSPEQPRAHHSQRHHHRRAESPSRDPDYIRHVKSRRSSDRHHDLPPPTSSRDIEPPVRKRRTTVEDFEDPEAVVEEADKKQKKSVFARISFPDEKKRKASSSSGSEFLSNGYKAKGEIKDEVMPTSLRSSVDEDYESSDDERHFKRRPSRYEPPPPPSMEWEEGGRPSRSSRERGHKHR